MKYKNIHRISLLFVFIVTMLVHGCESVSTTAPEQPASQTPVMLDEPSGPVGDAPSNPPPDLPSAASQRLQLAIPFANPLPINFYASSGFSGQIGVFYDGVLPLFQAQVPPDEYLLTYTTELGSFYIVFEATDNALITVGLQDGDAVYDAMLFRGTVTERSYSYIDDPVIVYSQFGARTGWEAIFTRDGSPGILLIGGIGVTYTPGVSIVLVLPRPATYHLEYHTNFGSYSVWFQTTAVQEIKEIPLQPGEAVWEAYLTIY